MNERIFELAAQFGPVATISNWGKVEWLDDVYPQLGDVMYADVDLQKFAELIIQECIEQVKIEQRNMGQLLTNPPQNSGVWDACNNIRKHFGIDDD